MANMSVELVEAQPEEQLAPSSATSLTSLKIWWPVLLASLAIAGINIAAIVVRMPYKCPLDPWESIIVSDAYRASAGLAVYTTPMLDHSTHIYGPLITYVTGFIFKFTGINFWVARSLSVIGAACIVLTMAVIFFRKLPAVFICAGVAMLLGINLRTDGYFMQARPDMEALAVALLALILMYHGFERNRYALYGLGVLMLCVAYLFKQTAAMFALVPLIKLVLKRDGVTAGELLMILAPPIAIGILIGVIRLAAPNVDYYMIEALARWPIQYARLAYTVCVFLAFMPIVPAALCLGLLWRRDERELTDRDRVLWLAAACIIATPASIVAFSKVGGVNNSYVPALFPLVTLSIILIARGWQTIIRTAHPPARRAQAFAWLLTFIMLASAFSGSSDQLRTMNSPAHGDAHYPQVVQYVSGLSGRVVCPDDPTIPIHALKQTGRSFWAENDATLADTMPQYLINEIRGADYLITVKSPWPKYLMISGLNSIGFYEEGWSGADMGAYTLWRKRVPSVPAAGR